MADVLLTHSNHLPYDRKQVRKMEPYPPLGTLYAAGLLRARGISAAVFDCMLQDPETGLREALRVHRPAIVAIYEDDFNFLTKMCLTRMRQLAWDMIEIARQHGARVIVHGSDATDHAADFLTHGAEYVIEGESEYTLLRLVQALMSGSTPVNIPGVVRLNHQGARATQPARLRNTFRTASSLPFPARDMIDLAPYRQAWQESHGMFSLNLIASRGCPFRCNWCAKPIFGDSYQLRPALDTALEMRLLKEKYGAAHLWFADDIFGLNRHWLQDFASAVEALHCAVPFKIQARADLLTSEAAQALRRSGCAEVWIGVESGSQTVLDAMDKGLLVEEVVSARNQLKRQGIRACYFLQLGYPGEQWIDIQKTIALVRETRPDDIGVSFSYPLPNTRFFARVKQQLGNKRNWCDSDDLCVMFQGTYTDRFYRAIRDALHAEVDSWKPCEQQQRQAECTQLWKSVESLEPVSKNLNPTKLPPVALASTSRLFPARNHFVPLQAVLAPTGEAND
ncbi:MAG TPA: radical SAM protein [Candidatus Eremiobacteraceae bacterium]|nr:radical SAM protein [Candidatus Eremiobacteraceae bacterium]